MNAGPIISTEKISAGEYLSYRYKALTEKDRKTIMETRSQKEMMEIIENAGFALKKEE